MNIKKILISITIALVIIIAAGAYFLFFRDGRFSNISDSGLQGIIGTLPQFANTDDEVDNGQVLPIGSPDPRFEKEVIAKELSNRSKIIVERIGSYSSDSDLSNISDLYSEMSENLQVVMEGVRNRKQNEFSNTQFFVGYLLTPVTTELTALDLETGSAVIRVDAEHETTNDGGEVTTENRTYVLDWQKNEVGQWELHGFSGNF